MKDIKYGQAKCKCGWDGTIDKCSVETFGCFCGDEGQHPDLWGWEEWDDWACPECGLEVDYNGLYE